MSQRFIFVRHARHLADPSMHPMHWTLNPLGFSQAHTLATVPEMLSADLLYASEEKKAELSLEPLATRLHQIIHRSAAFNEIWREEKFLTDAEFAAEKERQLTDLAYHAFNGESGDEALQRFMAGVHELERLHSGKTVVIASHGTILSIYFAHLLGAYDGLLARWKKTAFGAYGIIENGKVVRDIASA